MPSLYPAHARRNHVTSAPPATWSQAHEVRDFERWLDAVPSRHRARVRAHVEASAPAGRRDFWTAFHTEPARDVARELLRAATAKPKTCSRPGCRRHARAVTDGLDLLCMQHLTPGDVLILQVVTR